MTLNRKFLKRRGLWLALIGGGILLLRWVLVVERHTLAGRTVFEKEFPGKGVMSCVLVDDPEISAKADGHGESVRRHTKFPKVYRVLWQPQGATIPEILLQKTVGSRFWDSGGPYTGTDHFLPLDAHVWRNGRVLLVFRTQREIRSVFLQLSRTRKHTDVFWPWFHGDLVARENINSVHPPVKVYGAGQVAGDSTPTKVNLILDELQGREVFGFDGRGWKHLRDEPYPPFEREIPGLGKIVIQHSEIPVPKGFAEPNYDREELPEMKPLWDEIRDKQKSFAHIRSLHRHEFILVKKGSSERVSLFKKTTYFDPRISRCPRGFLPLDALLVGDRLYFVYKEQAWIRWARIDFTPTGVTARDSRDMITRDDLFRSYTKAMLRVADGSGGEGIRVEVAGWVREHSIPLTRDWYWENPADTDN